MRPTMRYALGGGLLSLLMSSAAIACLWDYDTIKMERARFPSTLELITGKFLRHSPEFYRWRIENRLARLQSNPDNPALRDDLAAAYDKTGQHDLAIAAALETERLFPGRYETAANLGTFYIHSGQLELGVAHIDNALRINPHAHFGREHVQKSLVEYVLLRRQTRSHQLPLAIHPTAGEGNLTDVSVQHTFADFLRAPQQQRLSSEESAAIIKGLLGMMRFGDHESPVLLEALGSVLADGYDPDDDAKLLAARALLKASYHAPDEPARIVYRRMAAGVLNMQSSRRDSHEEITLEQVEADFQHELEEGRLWYADLRARELAWMRDGRDPEAEFDKLYAADPEVFGMDVKDPKLSVRERSNVVLVVGSVLLLLIGLTTLGALAYFLLRPRPPPYSPRPRSPF